ncbi:Insulin-like growth factor-binding protein 3, partial [Camelus dromedarius]
RPAAGLLDGPGLCANASAAGRLRAYLLSTPPASGALPPGNGGNAEPPQVPEHAQPQGIHIPNCDKRASLQRNVPPFQGQNRGFCWCVDKYGQPLPGFDVKGGATCTATAAWRASRGARLPEDTAFAEAP